MAMHEAKRYEWEGVRKAGGSDEEYSRARMNRRTPRTFAVSFLTYRSNIAFVLPEKTKSNDSAIDYSTGIRE